ncbi:MAG TPA: hypothetical protein VHO70_12760 [Chitinispirillaceae bacterium]|nr:hypothetical protein [Chitinispirillaceae bacterium]
MQIPIQVVMLFFICSYSVLYAALPEECGKGKKHVFYKATEAVDSRIRAGFSDDFFDALNTPLKEIGYCPVFLESHHFGDTLHNNTPVLFVDVLEQVSDGEDTSTLAFQIYYFPLNEIRSDYTIAQKANLLISLRFLPDELSTFEAVAVRKTVENLRTQYVCHLRLESDPTGVQISSSIGLEGKTPLEWVTPVGDLEIEGEMKGYSVLRRNIKLDTPGSHTYVLEMKARQFYNSHFIIPTLVFGVSSAVLFGFERYYYSQYLDLDRETYFNNPDKFGKLFNKAKKFEYAAFASLGLTAVSFSCTFFF